ncbi:MAG: alanine--tRNA ligase [Acidobacteria bacterium]|nr:alanine--tRNA ligase [Acidobacteriota bacterium]
MTGHETRQRFIDFFAARGHRPVRSSSLVPANDPTLLFTNAGMNQFKDLFLGLEKRDYSRATTSQKCVRAGGKHNDLENVGYTRRHHTFFEMLGNFSFGDYFKAEAIEFAWDLITRDYGLSKDRLYVTVFREDDDAENLWQSVAGVPKSRIFRLDEKDNFWQMGDTGPCGPCSEIHYDLGPETAEPGREHEEFPLDGGGRFVEIWNLVFMQFDRSQEGKLTPLPRPSIDTGMGLERVAAVLQGKLSNFECDLIAPIIEHAAGLFGVTVGEDARTDTVLRICADHARAAAFLIHDGVLPSNEGRGYVLRKIMRRALRNARMIGVPDAFLYKMTGFVAGHMQAAYPEMLESVQRVARVVKDEEHRYANTFQVAEKIFHDEAKKSAAGVLPGAAAFKLYDTYGLALDEQEDMAREMGLKLDMAGFEEAMDRQREKARASWKGAEKSQVDPVYHELLAKGRTRFLGYDSLECERCTVVGVVDGKELVLDQTPFYAEAGGQVGDQGVLLDAAGEVAAEVHSVFPILPGLSVHRVTLHKPVAVGDTLRAQVNATTRHSTMRNHTATHLLHAALRTVLGTHVKQAGSVVDPQRLRFDFTHYTGLDAGERTEIERLVNEQILRNTAVTTHVMDLDRALETGAMALFGEKYGEQVRVVEIPGFSKELCGGTHAARTGDIGVAKVIYEGSSSAGVRRIEAITGPAVVAHYEQKLREQAEHAQDLERRSREKDQEIERLKNDAAAHQAGSLESQAKEVNGVKVLTARVRGLDRNQMRTIADSLRNKWKSAVVVLASGDSGAVAVVSAVTKDVTARVHAGKLAGSVAQAVGGKGGGRPDMAEGGGTQPGALDGALAAAQASIEGMLR